MPENGDRFISVARVEGSDFIPHAVSNAVARRFLHLPAEGYSLAMTGE